MKRLLHCIGVVALLAIVASATPILIDDFNTANNPAYPLGGFGSGNGTFSLTETGLLPVVHTIQGSRVVQLVTSGSGGASAFGMLTVDTGLGQLALAGVGTNLVAKAHVTWNNQPTGNFNPFVNLTSPDTTGLVINLQADHAGIEFTVVITDSLGATRTATYTSVAGDSAGLTARFIPWISFTGTGDLTSVRSIELFINYGASPVTAANVSVDYIMTGIPEPATFGMAGLALVGIGLLARRKK